MKKQTTTQTVSTQELSDVSSVTINGTSLDPTPFVSLSIDHYKAGDLIIGGVMNVSLNGKIYSTTGGGFNYVASQARDKLEGIGSVGDCIPIVINCGSTVLVNGYGVITSVQVDEGPDPTWTQIAPYTISVEVHENFGNKAVDHNNKAGSYVTDDEMIKDLSESVSISVDDTSIAVDTVTGSGHQIGKAHVKYDFDISVTGASIGCKDIISRKTGIDAAEQVIIRRIGNLEAGNITSSLADANQVNIDLSTYHNGSKFIQIRDMTADPVAGTLSVNGSLIIRPNNITHSDAFVEIAVESSKDVSRFGDTVVISGNIEGLDSTSYINFVQNFDFHPADKNKISAAESAWSSVEATLEAIAYAHLGTGIDPELQQCIDGSLLNICQYQLPESDFICTLREINRNITRNYGQGTLTFTSEWSTAKNCGIQGAAKTTTDVTHTYPTQLFAEFTIPFRGEPLLQNLGTTSKETISSSVTVLIEEAGCNDVTLTSVRGCARSKAQDLAYGEGANSQWYLTGDSVQYNNTGQITVNLEYTKNYDCY